MDIKDKQLINEEIRDPRVFVVDDTGAQIGAMNTRDAIRLARDKDLDLVLFVASTKPGKLSVCKIIDYGKYSYQKLKKIKENKKKQVVVKTKEVKVKPLIGPGDLQWKSKQANVWLQDGCQVKFKVMTFGRIATKKELIDKVYNDFLKLIENNGKVATPLKQVSPVCYEATIVKK